MSSFPVISCAYPRTGCALTGSMTKKMSDSFVIFTMDSIDLFMEQTIFDYILQTRDNFVRLVDSLSVTQLNHVPPGFHNNIAWNFGHIAVAFPGLMYLKSAVDPAHYITHLKRYGPGSRPESFIDEEEIRRLREYVTRSVHDIRKDYESGKFKTITPFSTVTFKLHMQTAEEILQCSFAHDNYHLAYALAIRNLVQ